MGESAAVRRLRWRQGQRLRLGWGVAGALWAAAGCMATMQATVERQADGTVKLSCQAPLPRCLERAEAECRGTRYTVMSAADHHDYMGSQSSVGETEARSSEAVFRCGPRGRSLFASDADARAAAPAAAGAAKPAAPESGAPPVPSRACVPGSTQACVGPGACRGGQSCRPDGAGYAACDCGGSPAPAAVTDAPQNRDSGPAPPPASPSWPSLP